MIRRVIGCLLVLSACSDDASAPPAVPEPPAQPRSVSATGSNGQILVSWEDVPTETRYEVAYHPANSVATIDTVRLPANTLSMTHATATLNVTYMYKVTACNDAGCSTAPVVSAKWMPPVQPPTLTAFTLDSVAWLRADFNVAARSGGAAVSFEFRIFRAGEAAPFRVETIAAEPYELGDLDQTAFARYVIGSLQP